MFDYDTTDMDDSEPAVNTSRGKKAKRPPFKGKDGAVFADSQVNIMLALDDIGVRLSYDRLKGKPLADGKPYDDYFVNYLWLRIDRDYGFRPNRELFNIMVEHMAWSRGFQPVLDYLDGLRWDQKARLDTWLVDYLGAEDGELTRAVGPLLPIAAVRRVKEPGTKFDELLTLEGPEGIGKSTAIRKLAVRDEWFTDELTLNAGTKVLMEQTSGFWIVEASELTGLNKADWGRLKAVLARQRDVARAAYARRAQERPRQFIPIGTTNKHEYLSDPTGNRRWWPIRLGDQVIDQDKIVADRDQLWAEAVVREKAGADIRLPKELWGVAAQAQAERTRDDPWLEVIAEKIGDREGRITSETLWHIVGLADVNRREHKHQARISGAMQKLGWRRPGDNGRFSVRGERVSGWARGEQGAGRVSPLWELRTVAAGDGWSRTALVDVAAGGEVVR